MITYQPSFARALAVAQILLSSEQLQAADAYIYIEAYQNGREQGITIKTAYIDKAIFIAQHRNTDGLVAYVGKYAMQSLSDDAYKHPQHFQTVDDCVEFIIETLAPSIED